ncbi:MAG: hypothetical protein HOQ05_07940 [Corynebacteriales bacterium]|nr:hypothetical protein [Mycobacteriales bacterium]
MNTRLAAITVGTCAIVGSLLLAGAPASAYDEPYDYDYTVPSSDTLALPSEDTVVVESDDDPSAGGTANPQCASEQRAADKAQEDAVTKTDIANAAKEKDAKPYSDKTEDLMREAQKAREDRDTAYDKLEKCENPAAESNDSAPKKDDDAPEAEPDKKSKKDKIIDGAISNAEDIEQCNQKGDCAYVWGGKGPKNFDCSGLVWWVYKEAGYKWSYRPTGGLLSTGDGVSMKSLKPGDILVNSGHTGLYIGDGKVIHAAGNNNGTRPIKDQIKKESLETFLNNHSGMQARRLKL